jgi:hypothetical protein
MDEEPLRQRLLKLAALRFGDCALQLGSEIDSLTVALADSAEGIVVATVKGGASSPSTWSSADAAWCSNILLLRTDSLAFTNGQFNVVVAAFRPPRRSGGIDLQTLEEAWRLLLPRGKLVAAYWEDHETGALPARSCAA